MKGSVTESQLRGNMECPSPGVRTYENGVGKNCWGRGLVGDVWIAGHCSDSLPAKVPGRPGAIGFGSGGPGLYADRSRAQRQYEKKNGHFATSLSDLVHIVFFTRRIVIPEQGDYTVTFRSHEDGFECLLPPNCGQPAPLFLCQR